MGDGFVVWTDGRHGNWDLYGHDLAAGREVALVVDPGPALSPHVSGSRLVWSTGTYTYDSAQGDILAMDLDTGQTFPVCTVGGGQAYPRVSGNLVVWQDDVGGQTDVWGAYVPEPATLLLAAAGAAGLLARRRRRAAGRRARFEPRA